VTWLYGPLQYRAENVWNSSLASEPLARWHISSHNTVFNRKPVLKRRVMSKMMLQRPLSASSLLREAVAALNDPNTEKAKPFSANAQNSFNLGLPSIDSTALELTTSSGLISANNDKTLNVHFDERVEQFIALESTDGEAYPLDNNDSDPEDGWLMMKRSNSQKKWPLLSNRSKSKAKFDDKGKTITILPSIRIKDEEDNSRNSEIPHSYFNSTDVGLSPSDSLITIRASYPSTKLFLGDDTKPSQSSSSRSLEEDVEGSAVDQSQTSPNPEGHYLMVPRTVSEMLMSSGEDNDDQESLDRIESILGRIVFEKMTPMLIEDTNTEPTLGNQGSLTSVEKAHTIVSLYPTADLKNNTKASNSTEAEEVSPNPLGPMSLAPESGLPVAVEQRFVECGNHPMSRNVPGIDSSSTTSSSGLPVLDSQFSSEQSEHLPTSLREPMTNIGFCLHKKEAEKEETPSIASSWSYLQRTEKSALTSQAEAASSLKSTPLVGTSKEDLQSSADLETTYSLSTDVNQSNADVEKELSTEYNSSEYDGTESGSSTYRELSALTEEEWDSQDQIISSILDPARRSMVERVMEEFWMIFDRSWDNGFSECAGASSSSSSEPQDGSTDSTTHSFSPFSPRKRQREEEPPQDGQGQDSHKTPENTGWEINRDDDIRFACPYRKHDPRRYNVYSHPVCTISHWGTIARVKYVNKFLFRPHAPYNIC
jgi:hypothetical protein